MMEKKNNEQQPNEKQHAPASSEQAADLAALESIASAEGNAAALVQQTQTVDERGKLAMELAGITQTFVAMASPVLPSLAKIYTAETVEAATQAAAAVCVKHGWLQGGVFDGYGEEITAAIVLGPLAFATYHGVRGDIAKLGESEPAKQDKPKEPVFKAAPPADEVGSAKVVIGSVIPGEGVEDANHKSE